MLPGLGRAVSEGRLSLREAAGLNRELLVAVTDSAVNHLSSAMVLLARHPALLDALHEDERLLEPFIEEALRLESPLPASGGGVGSKPSSPASRCRPGASCCSPILRSNRDSDAHAPTDKADLHRRQPKCHLTCEHGIHFCVGARLARPRERGSVLGFAAARETR